MKYATYISKNNQNYKANVNISKRQDISEFLNNIKSKNAAIKPTLNIVNKYLKNQTSNDKNKFENNYNMNNLKQAKAYAHKRINKDNNHQNLDTNLTRAHTSQPKSNNTKYTVNDRNSQINNFMKNEHISIESKDLKKQGIDSIQNSAMYFNEAKIQDKASPYIYESYFSKNEENLIRIKSNLKNKNQITDTKNKQDIRVKKKKVNVNNISTPSKNEKGLENSEKENTSQKKTIQEFSINESQEHFEKNKMNIKYNQQFIQNEDMSQMNQTDIRFRANPNAPQIKKEPKNNDSSEINKKESIDGSNKKNLKIKDNQINAMIDKFKKEINDKQKAINKYENINKIQTESLNEKIKENEELKELISKMNNKLNQKKEEIEKIKNEYENEIINKDNQIKQLLDKIKSNSIQEKENNNNIKNLELVISQKDIKISKLNEQLEEALNEIKKMKEENEKNNKQEKINIQKSQLEKRKNELEKLKGNLLDKQNIIKNKERILNEKTKFIEQNELAFQSELDKFERDKKQYSNNLNEIKNEINNLNMKKLELENTIKMQMEQINKFNQSNMNNINNNNNNNMMNMNMNINMINSANNNMNYNLMNNMSNFMNNNSNMMMNPMNFPMFNNNINFSMNNSNFDIPKNGFDQFKTYNNFNPNNLNNNNNNNNNNNPKNSIIKKSVKKSQPLDFFKQPTLIGLQNIGATCFMNATLQCLSQTADLTNYFLDEPRSFNKIMNNNIAMKKNTELQLSPVYLELVKNLWNKNSTRKYYQPKKFMETVEAMNPLFKLGQAGDSKDFIIFILEQFHTELKINKNNNSADNNAIINQYDQQTAFKNFIEDFKKQTSIISDIFYGIQETNNTCLNCKNYFSRQGKQYPICYNYQIFNCLIFPLEEVRRYRYNYNSQIKTVTLEDCFYYNEKMDHFTGDNKNYCNICKKTCDSDYISKIYSAPNTLILILNRGKNNCFDVKLNFKETIDITNFVSVKTSNIKYNLYGVITHYGESGPSAHFLAFCKSPINNKWYRYNDAMVTFVNNLQKDVIEFGSPYILFYKQEYQK